MPRQESLEAMTDALGNRLVGWLDDFFWWLIHKREPPKDPLRRQATLRAFQRLWVAGTLGAFFSLLVRNIPLDWQERSWPGDFNYTADRFIRYGYLFWFIAYFLISNLDNDYQDPAPTWKELFYDVVQSAGALTAAFFLGFGQPDAHYRLYAHAIFSGEIALICTVSLIFFHKNATAGVNLLRAVGGVISFAAVALALWSDEQKAVFVLLGALHLGLWAVLLSYLRIRVDMPSKKKEANGKAIAKKDGLAGLATKDDIEKLATKDEMNVMLEELKKEITDLHTYVVTKQDLIDEVKKRNGPG